MCNRRSQVFSTDMVIAVVVFLLIIVSSSWFWDMTKEKIHMSEVRNDLELEAHNAVSVLINTVGDPPNWHKKPFSETSVYSLGIGKNRPWMLDEDKIEKLSSLNDTDYETIKKILGIRGATYEFHLNVSRFNRSDNTFTEMGLVGVMPNESASQVVGITRFALTDNGKTWTRFDMLVWNSCSGAEC